MDRSVEVPAGFLDMKYQACFFLDMENQTCYPTSKQDIAPVITAQLELPPYDIGYHHFCCESAVEELHVYSDEHGAVYGMSNNSVSIVPVAKPTILHSLQTHTLIS